LFHQGRSVFQFAAADYLVRPDERAKDDGDQRLRRQRRNDAQPLSFLQDLFQRSEELMEQLAAFFVQIMSAGMSIDKNQRMNAFPGKMNHPMKDVAELLPNGGVRRRRPFP